MRQVYLFEVKNDLFDVAERLQEIDKHYVVFWNAKEQCFEVHNSRQKGNTFCLKVPFDCLDSRTVDLVISTRVCNSQRLFDEIERQNQIVEKAKKEAALKKTLAENF